MRGSLDCRRCCCTRLHTRNTAHTTHRPQAAQHNSIALSPTWSRQHPPHSPSARRPSLLLLLLPAPQPLLSLQQIPPQCAARGRASSASSGSRRHSLLRLTPTSSGRPACILQEGFSTSYLRSRFCRSRFHSNIVAVKAWMCRTRSTAVEKTLLAREDPYPSRWSFTWVSGDLSGIR